MTLRVINVPNPAAGTDWRYTIPAQWLVRVVSVYASLTTAQNPTTVADSSPNNETLAVNPTRTDLVWGVTGPFGSGGGNAVRSNVNGTQNYLAKGPNAGQYDVPTFTCEALVNVNAAAPIGFQVLIGLRRDGNPDLTLRWMFGILNNVLSQIRVAASSGDVFNIPGVFAENSWHHVAVTYDGAQWVGYVDGIATGTVVGHPPTAADTLCDLTIGGDIPSVQTLHGDLAACALFSGVLSGAQIAAHVAAVATSSAAYRAAVLSDSPLALWMLNDAVTHGSRIAQLEITDGTTVVGDYPGSAGTGTGATFSWTWAPKAPGADQSADGSTNYVKIPDLTLPGGYTIGTDTPGIGGQDQWSDVAIWWDDGAIGPAGPIGPYEYPPGALLKFRQTQG